MTLVRAVQRLRRDDRGLTLAEVLVASAITLVVLALVTSAAISGMRLQSATDAEASGQFDVRTTIERLGRDVRNARSVEAGATASELKMWIDNNRDYSRQDSEITIWKLRQTRVSPPEFEVLRTAGVLSVVERVQSRLVVANAIFCYRRLTTDASCLPTPLSAAQAASARIVDSRIEYDAITGTGTGARSTVFSERLRNVT